MFQLKNFVSIAASMLNYVRSTTGKVTDLQPGSVTRTILEAPAAEIEELYIQIFNGIQESIPVAVYNTVNFARLPPAYASGRVTVIANIPPGKSFVVPAGTQFLARDGRIYEAIGDLTWAAGKKSLPVPVRSVQAGYEQNAAAGEINSSSFFDPDDYTFSSTAITGGTDEESDDARKSRFGDYIASLSRGTETAIRYGAQSAYITDDNGNITECVARVGLEVSSGYVKVYIWSSAGQPSQALLARAQAIESGVKDPDTKAITPGFAAAGIRCEVGAMQARTVDVNYRITLFSGYSLDTQLKQQIRDSLDSRLQLIAAGETVYVNDIVNAALLVRGVKTAAADISQNILCGSDEVLMAGNITVTDLEQATGS